MVWELICTTAVAHTCTQRLQWVKPGRVEWLCRHFYLIHNRQWDQTMFDVIKGHIKGAICEYFRSPLLPGRWITDKVKILTHLVHPSNSTSRSLLSLYMPISSEHLCFGSFLGLKMTESKTEMKKFAIFLIIILLFSMQLYCTLKGLETFTITVPLNNVTLF